MRSFTIKAITELLHVDRPKVARWIRCGKLRAIDVSDTRARRQYRVLEDDLERFLKTLSVTPPQKRTRVKDPTPKKFI